MNNFWQNKSSGRQLRESSVGKSFRNFHKLFGCSNSRNFCKLFDLLNSYNFCKLFCYSIFRNFYKLFCHLNSRNFCKLFCLLNSRNSCKLFCYSNSRNFRKLFCYWNFINICKLFCYSIFRNFHRLFCHSNSRYFCKLFLLSENWNFFKSHSRYEQAFTAFTRKENSFVTIEWKSSVERKEQEKEKKQSCLLKQIFADALNFGCEHRKTKAEQRE